MAGETYVCACCGRECTHREPDIDMATDATPDQTIEILKGLGLNPILVGKAYGTISARAVGGKEPPEMCGQCQSRGGLCLHNIGTRAAALPPGTPVPFHYSRPHRDDTGAEDPETCQWCLARLL